MDFHKGGAGPGDRVSIHTRFRVQATVPGDYPFDHPVMCIDYEYKWRNYTWPDMLIRDLKSSLGHGLSSGRSRASAMLVDLRHTTPQPVESS